LDRYESTGTIRSVFSLPMLPAARWHREHFDVKHIPKGQHLADARAIRPYKVGHEKPIALLIKSGIWTSLASPTQRIVPVLLCFAERGNAPETLKVRLSYRAIQRYSGVRSFQSISKALQQLEELWWLRKVPQTTVPAYCGK